MARAARQWVNERKVTCAIAFVKKDKVSRVQRGAARHETNGRRTEARVPVKDYERRHRRVKSRRQNGHHPSKSRVPARFFVEQIPGCVDKRSREDQRER